MRASFTWRSVDSGTGWVPDHIANADPCDPSSAAHDACEHAADGGAGGLEGECRAFGALAFGRLQHGWIAGGGRRLISREELGAELGGIVARDPDGFSDAPLPRVRLTAEERETFGPIVRAARRAYVLESWHGSGGNITTSRAIKARMPVLLALGFRRARRIYGTSEAAVACWEAVACVIGNAMARAEREDREQDGARLIVTFHPRECTARAVVKNSRWGY